MPGIKGAAQMWVYLQEVTEGAVSDGNIQGLDWVDVSTGLQLPMLGTEGTWVKVLSDFSVLFFINNHLTTEISIKS